MPSNSNNIVKRLKDDENLFLYHDYRIIDPETGKGSLVDHSGGGHDGTLSTSNPAYDTDKKGYTFLDDQYISVADSIQLDNFFNGDEVTAVVLVDELTTDNSDSTNTGQTRRDFATHLYRRTAAVGPTYPHDWYSGISYLATSSTPGYSCQDNENIGFWQDHSAAGVERRLNNGHRLVMHHRGANAPGDTDAWEIDVDGTSVANSNVISDYAGISANNIPLYIGNANRNPNNSGPAASTFIFPCQDHIQAVMLINRRLTDAEKVELADYLLAFDSGDIKRHFGSQGGVRSEFVFHVLGYPYGVATSRACADALDANLNFKRRIYGLAATSGTYWADTAPTFDLLEPPGSMRIGVDYEKASITGGNWKAVISNQQIGYSWPHRVDKANQANDTVSVLDGIATIPDVREDTSIIYGELAGDTVTTDTTMDVKDMVGGDLATKVNTLAAAGDHTVLFIGDETIATGGIAGSGYDITLQTLTRGLYKSKIQSHIIEDFDNRNEVIADAPIGGAAGRYYELYMIPLDDATGAPLDEPFLMRYGQVQNDVSISRDSITLACGSLNTAIRKSPAREKQTGQLAKYVLTRPSDLGSTVSNQLKNSGPAPHIMISERGLLDTDTTSYVTSIWLCDRGDTVTFDTLEDLLTAMQTELNYLTAASASQKTGDGTAGNAISQLTYSYNVTRNGIYSPDAETYIEYDTSTGLPKEVYNWPIIGGVLPWLLGLIPLQVYARNGLSQREYNNIDMWIKYMQFVNREPTFDPNDVFSYHTAKYLMSPVAYKPWDESGTAGNQIKIDDPSAFGQNHFNRAQYIVMPDYESLGTEVQLEKLGAKKRQTWPIPSPLYTKPGFDASRLASEVCTLGSVDGNGPWGTVNVTTVSQTNEWDELTLTTGNGHEFELTSGDQALKMDSRSAGNGLDAFTPLYWIPGPNDLPDPWQIRPNSIIEASTAGELFRGIAGDSVTGAEVPEKWQLGGLPWLIDDTRKDFYEGIDWDSFDAAMKPITNNHFYQARLGTSDFTFSTELWNELMFHGVTPIWAPDFNDRMWKMKFRQLGPVDRTKAVWEGRSFGDDSIVASSDDEFVLTGSSVLNAVRVMFQYDEDQNKYMQNITLDNNAAKQVTKDAKLDIKSKLSRLEEGYKLDNPNSMRKFLARFMRIIRHFAASQAKYSLRSTVSKLWVAQPGSDATVTDESVLNVATGEWGLSSHPVQIVSVNTDFSRSRQTIGVEYRTTKDAEYSIAPAMIVPANDSVKDISKVVITPSEHEFSDVVRRVDMSWFDCLNYEPNTSSDSSDSANYTDRGCSCGDYAVLAFRTDQEVPTVMSFTVKNMNIDAGTCELWGTTTSWDTTKEHAVIYAKWDDADLQDCQREFLCYADKDNKLIDSGAAVTRGHKIL